MTERLLALLQDRANHRGLVMIREDVLLRDIETTHDRLATAIEAIERDGAIEVLAPLPFLVIKGLKWSGSSPTASPILPDSTRSESDLHIEVPVSKQAAAAAAFKQQDGGVGEGEALLDEVIVALGESDPSEFRPIVEGYPAPIIRQVLRRVALTPSSQIRKSKAALFRYLLGKLA